MTNRTTRRATLAAVAAGAALAAVPSGAAAAEGTWICSATPLAGSLLGQALPTPSAGNPTGACANDRIVPALPANPLLSLEALNGVTAASPDGVFAGASLANVGVGSIPVPIPAIPIPAELQNIEIRLPLGPLGASIPVARVNLTRAIQAIQSLPSRNLLGAQALASSVTGVCTNGQPSIVGNARVLGAQVLGLDVDPNRAVDSAVNLVDTTDIALSTLDTDLVDIELLGGIVGVDNAAVLGALRPILAGLPPIQIPAQVAQVKLTPGSTEVVNGVTISRALRAQISLAGRSLADLSIGQSAVGAVGNPCATGTVAGAALECTTRDLTLIDVVRQGNRVRLFGAADQRLAGRTAIIRFQATGRDVARVRIARDGSFTTTAPLPARSIRGTNRARYVARVGNERSLNLKLQRRMIVTQLRSRDGKVTIAGRVVRPLGSPVQPIVLRRRVSCERFVTVARFRPNRNGRFRVTADAPEGARVGVYRLQTRVRNNVRNPKLFPTFTLPRAVNL